MKYVFGLMLFISGLAHALTCTNLPVGATVLGYTTQVFYDQPTLTEISTTNTDTTSKWYPGTLASREYLSIQSSELAIALGGGITSHPHGSKPGAIPFLSGAQGFYVEFAMRLSSNEADHFEGLYLQTAEHADNTDHLSTDPAGFERWTEIDVSESGYGPGSLATVINWWGTNPHYTHQTFNNYGHDLPLDYTKEHIYGLSYDPATNVLQWYIDNVPTWKATPVNSVIKDFHYNLVMAAASHGSHVGYDMFIRYVTAYTK
jgi:hypothetical protein